MATNFLSGFTQGTRQGLANMVASKRADRQVARDQRRYENALMFQLRESAAAARDREKRFAYTAARDTARDTQWAQEMGLREEIAAENVRQFGELFTQRAEQFDATQAENIRQFDETLGQRRTEFLAADTDRDAELAFRKQQQIDEMKDRGLARQLTEKRDQGLIDYYQEQIRLKEQELNRPLTALELAEIDERKARAEYYRRRPATGTRASTPIRPTWLQGGDLSAGMGTDLARRFADRGAAFTWNPVGADMGGRLTPEKILPFTESTPFPYDEATGGAEGHPTQVSVMRDMGAEVFERLWRETGDIHLALQRMEQAYDAMLLDEAYGPKVRNYMQQYGPENAEQELRKYFLEGADAAIERLRIPPVTGSPSEQIEIPERW